MFFYPDSLSFSVYKSIIFYVQVERQEAVEEAVEFQDGTLSLLLLLFLLC